MRSALFFYGLVFHWHILKIVVYFPLRIHLTSHCVQRPLKYIKMNKSIQPEFQKLRFSMATMHFSFFSSTIFGHRVSHRMKYECVHHANIMRWTQRHTRSLAHHERCSQLLICVLLARWYRNIDGIIWYVLSCSLLLHDSHQYKYNIPENEPNKWKQIKKTEMERKGRNKNQIDGSVKFFRWKIRNCYGWIHIKHRSKQRKRRKKKSIAIFISFCSCVTACAYFFFIFLLCHHSLLMKLMVFTFWIAGQWTRTGRRTFDLFSFVQTIWRHFTEFDYFCDSNCWRTVLGFSSKPKSKPHWKLKPKYLNIVKYWWVE